MKLELLTLVDVFICLPCLPVHTFSGWYCWAPLAPMVWITTELEE
jgi:hypothetical protein